MTVVVKAKVDFGTANPIRPTPFGIALSWAAPSENVQWRCVRRDYHVKLRDLELPLSGATPREIVFTRAAPLKTALTRAAPIRATPWEIVFSRAAPLKTALTRAHNTKSDTSVGCAGRSRLFEGRCLLVDGGFKLVERLIRLVDRQL